MCPISHTGQFLLPILQRPGDFFPLENIKQKISVQMREDAMPKTGELSKPMRAKCWFTPIQVLFLCSYELKTYLYVSLARVVSHAQS